MRGARVKKIRAEFAEANGRPPRPVEWGEIERKRRTASGHVVAYTVLAVTRPSEMRAAKRAYRMRRAA